MYRHRPPIVHGNVHHVLGVLLGLVSRLEGCVLLQLHDRAHDRQRGAVVECREGLEGHGHLLGKVQHLRGNHADIGDDLVEGAIEAAHGDGQTGLGSGQASVEDPDDAFADHVCAGELAVQGGDDLVSHPAVGPDGG